MSNINKYLLDKYMRKLGVKIVVFFLAALTLGYLVVYPIFTPNISSEREEFIVFIPTQSSFDDVLNILNENNVLKNQSSFRFVAQIMKYNKDNVPGGKYILKQGMSNREIISKLRSGNQNAQKVVINNIRLISDLAGKAASYLEADSLAFINYFSDPEVHTKYGLSQDDFMTLFIPNTYEMWWNYTPEKFTERMKSEYNRFWNEERLAKIKNKNLTPTEAYIVASIVEKESNYDPERPTIAGVYLNRLKDGMKLQADPTVVYAAGDFSIQRVLYKHLEIDSPYNTYMYNGLPPGPICMPSIQSLLAVVDSEDHDYYYFCARADNSGIHAFAKTYNDHQKNAAAFAAWLNSRNIK